MTAVTSNSPDLNQAILRKSVIMGFAPAYQAADKAINSVKGGLRCEKAGDVASAMLGATAVGALMRAALSASAKVVTPASHLATGHMVLAALGATAAMGATALAGRAVNNYKKTSALDTLAKDLVKASPGVRMDVHTVLKIRQEQTGETTDTKKALRAVVASVGSKLA